jgi:hypothetical protein
MLKPREEVFLQYKGPVQYDTIGYLIGELKEKMFEAQIKQAVYKKVLMVMIESLENIFKYHEFFDNDKKILKEYPPQLLITKNPEFFRIECSNPIRIKDVYHFNKRLEDILKLDKNGIKEVYKQTITNGQFSEKGGAGLGIIEIAKISDEKIDFNFLPINADFELYTLSLIIYRT